MELTIIGLAIVLTIVCILYAVELNTVRRLAETIEDNKILIAHLFDVVRGVRDEIDNISEPPAYVTDPVKKPKHIYQSEGGIIVPKTPEEIRAEHYAEIKKGAEYGSAE